MTDPWTAALQEAYASAPADEFVISTLELLHPAFETADSPSEADSIRIVLDERDWDLTLEAAAPLHGGESVHFSSLALQVSLPEQTEGTLGQMQLALDNVPRDIWTKLQAAARVRATAAVIYREWVAIRNMSTGVYTCTGTPDMIIDQLSVKVITASILRMEATAQFVDLLNKAFPRRTFDRDSFPGLFGGST